MARTRHQPAAPVLWRDGIHLAGTPIWCDARRAREVCFVSAAHAIGRARHGQLIATAPTLALIGEGEQQTGTRLSVPYGRPFTLGTVRLELIRSGHCLGSASLLVEADGQRILYAGAVCPRGGGLGGTADLRQCDALVLSASYGDPQFAFAEIDRVVAQVVGFCQEVTGGGGVAVLLVSSPGKALDVATRLRDGAPHMGLFAHRSIVDATRALRATHPALPRLRRYAGRAPVGHVLLWPLAQRADLPAPLPAASRVALVSGGALDAELLAELALERSPGCGPGCAHGPGHGIDIGFGWSNQADFTELVRYIEASGARQVYLTGGGRTDALIAAVSSPGRLVRVLGPPRQMQLF